MLPITTFIICLIQIIEFYIYNLKLKKGEILKFGNDKLSIVNKILGIIGGLALIFLGYFFLESEFAYKGINGTMFLGFYIFILGLTDTSNFSYLFKGSAFVFTDYFTKSLIKYEKVEQLVIGKDFIAFIHNGIKKGNEILPNDKLKINSLINYLNPRLKEKLTIEI
jgi:hypothetical protein